MFLRPSNAQPGAHFAWRASSSMTSLQMRAAAQKRCYNAHATPPKTSPRNPPSSNIAAPRS
jgi:hypothetical protein